MQELTTKDYSVKLETGNLEDVALHLANAYQRNQNYFSRTIPFFDILVREPEVNEHNAQNWLIGTPGYGNESLTVMRPIFLKEARDYSSLDFENLVTHEICHRFQVYHFDFRVPFWLYEGLAGYIGKQVDPIRYGSITKEEIIPIRRSHSPSEFYTNLNYDCVFSIVHLLHEMFSKDKIFEFMKISNNSDTFEESGDKFSKVFKMSIDEFEQPWMKFLNS
jgi:hypothetical protein|tara:strand:+ start:4205 stop:4864 length:660 start_codon:yes stop_codon:yes gene_type:complete